jgi:uncharacterized protein YkwD
MRARRYLLALIAAAALVLPARAAGDWSRLPAEKFARLPELQQRIDPAHFDEALLSTAIFHETNRVRRRLGLPLFKHLEKLDAAAELKAAAGVLEPELRHESALPAHALPADRVKSVGLEYRIVAENLARLPAYDLPEGVKKVGVRKRGGREEYYRLDTGRALERRTYENFAVYVVDSWMNSPGHRANIVNAALTSLGCAARPCEAPVSGHEQVYAVQVFFTPR